jgi:hypothetical protein
MRYLLRKYHPSGSSVAAVDTIYQDITNGDHLWVKDYPPEIANFVEARKKKLDKQ